MPLDFTAFSLFFSLFKFLYNPRALELIKYWLICARMYHNLSANSLVYQLVPAIGVIVLAWGLLPLLRLGWNIFLHVFIFLFSVCHVIGICFWSRTCIDQFCCLWSSIVSSIQKNGGNWRRSTTYFFATSYVQPLLLWTGALLICRCLKHDLLTSWGSSAGQHNGC